MKQNVNEPRGQSAAETEPKPIVEMAEDDTPADPAVADEASETPAEQPVPAGETAGPEAVAASQEIERLSAELNTARDRHLRLAAEFENFRKRTARERAEQRVRAQADIVQNLLGALDDLTRVLDIDVAAAGTEDVMTGVELVARNLLKELGTAGLERTGEVGEPFDPNRHEAIGSMPAQSEELDHTVGSVLQPGYLFGGNLLRPARVQVCLWQGDPSATA